MESVKLAEVLRSLSESFDPNAYEPWAKVIRPLLPDEPLSNEFLDGVLDPMKPFVRGIVLDHLLRLGRSEVAERVVSQAECGGTQGSILAQGLIETGDARGYDILERLYIYGTEHPNDKLKPCYPDDIFGYLVDRGDEDRRALTLRMRLVAWKKQRSGS